MSCETWCIREPEHAGQCVNWIQKRDDDSLAGALAGIERIRAAGPLHGNRLFCVARDLCLEFGVIFSITSNRRVNIRKGNRPRNDVNNTVRRLDGWFREVYGPALEHILPRQRYLRWDSDRIFVEELTAVGMDALSPANGFTYAGAHGAIELLESPYLRDGEAVLINGQVFTGAVIDEHADHVSGHARALMAAINARPAAGVSAREVDGRILLASTPAARVAMVEHMLEQGMLYGIGAARVVWDQADRPIGQSFEQAIVLPTPLLEFRKGISRLPAFIPQRRLDGRRAR